MEDNQQLLDDELLRSHADKPFGKVFTGKAIRNSVFFGGPLVAGYMMAKNFKTVGESHKMSTAWLGVIGYTIAFMALNMTVLADINIPGIAFSVMNAFIAWQVFKSYQMPMVKNHVDQGGETESIGHAVVAVILSVIATALPIVIYFLAVDGSLF